MIATSLVNLAEQNVKEFIVRNDLSLDVDLAMKVLKDSFTSEAEITLDLVRDRESDYEWLVVRAKVDASPETVIDSYSKAVNDWTGTASPRGIDQITLSYEIV